MRAVDDTDGVAVDGSALNRVLLCGRVSIPADERRLPSGDTIMTTRVVIDRERAPQERGVGAVQAADRRDRLRGVDGAGAAHDPALEAGRPRLCRGRDPAALLPVGAGTGEPCGGGGDPSRGCLEAGG